MSLLPMRYLDAAAVRASLPTVHELVDLAEVALRSLVAGAEVPERAALPASPAGVFAGAMPARLTAIHLAGGGAERDLLGMKWISGGVSNRARGLPALASLIVLNDPSTGVLTAIVDGDAVTAARTAALSGVAVRLLVHRDRMPAARRAVLIGAGVQAKAHAGMLGALLPGVALAIHDRHPERAEAVAAEAAGLEGVSETIATSDPSKALREADVVVTATSLAGRPEPGAGLGPGDVAAPALVLPVDYAAYVSAELVRTATTFLVDHVATFEANRRSGRLVGWPDPSGSLGELLIAGYEPASRPPGLAVALHQGPGVADVIVADAVLRRATALGLGLVLER
jgi:ornithine cyclodeaminase/alanine dehydrogenase-like protein (mu-crystallin family)